jgi:hypothetical protein
MTEDRAYNIELAIEEIRKFPQTYNTILGDFWENGTLQTILRRKLNGLCKGGDVCKTNIPGTRFGKAIFYSIPKSYYILVENDRIGVNVFCFFSFEKISRYYLKVDKLWRLEGHIWKEIEGRTFFEGNVLKLI